MSKVSRYKKNFSASMGVALGLYFLSSLRSLVEFNQLNASRAGTPMLQRKRIPIQSVRLPATTLPPMPWPAALRALRRAQLAEIGCPGFAGGADAGSCDIPSKRHNVTAAVAPHASQRNGAPPARYRPRRDSAGEAISLQRGQAKGSLLAFHHWSKRNTATPNQSGYILR
ncbi:hypothetical protein JQ633_20030 [Bradyrhizobium tropiciagri]|uniref:hypothetical protein n=1 Tax=Bradyrhizobium tropiciagri TaxID=312253 RepID=UPI001BAA44B9|nr:hypothetical protein [Bradyrhizobium tropiciagri]MBR0872662.1 hypothetical protein [Bradyrhizobium tropiciagri]